MRACTAACKAFCWCCCDEEEDDEWFEVVLDAELSEDGEDGEPIDLFEVTWLLFEADAWPCSYSESFIADIL